MTGDGLLAFSPLMASGLVDVAVFHRRTFGPLMPYYQIRLSDKGQATMKAWKEGYPKAPRDSLPSRSHARCARGPCQFLRPPWGRKMKPALWLLLGIVIGGIAGRFARGLTKQDVRANTKFINWQTGSSPMLA